MSALLISNSREWVNGGRTFKQVSLSQYYRGLDMVFRQESAAKRPRGRVGRVFLPVRRFRSDSLLTADGASILERLLANCSLIIIQDADLRPQDLLEHRDRIWLSDAAVVDMTGSMGSRGYFFYAIGQSQDPALRAIGA